MTVRDLIEKLRDIEPGTPVTVPGRGAQEGTAKLVEKVEVVPVQGDGPIFPPGLADASQTMTLVVRIS